MVIDIGLKMNGYGGFPDHIGHNRKILPPSVYQLNTVPE
jgi:hypothetical protein